jgi:hypothetical protein
MSIGALRSLALRPVCTSMLGGLGSTSALLWPIGGREGERVETMTVVHSRRAGETCRGKRRGGCPSPSLGVEGGSRGCRGGFRVPAVHPLPSSGAVRPQKRALPPPWISLALGMPLDRFEERTAQSASVNPHQPRRGNRSYSRKRRCQRSSSSSAFVHPGICARHPPCALALGVAVPKHGVAHGGRVHGVGLDILRAYSASVALGALGVATISKSSPGDPDFQGPAVTLKIGAVTHEIVTLSDFSMTEGGVVVMWVLRSP